MVGRPEDKDKKGLSDIIAVKSTVGKNFIPFGEKQLFFPIKHLGFGRISVWTDTHLRPY